MTATRESDPRYAPATEQVPLGRMFDTLFPGTPLRFSAYDGSTGGDPTAAIGIRLIRPRGVSYMVTSPGSLGMARAYLQGDLEVDGIHPGDPYELLAIIEGLHMRRPSPADGVQWLRTLGPGTLVPPPPPPLEQRPTKRIGFGLRHSKLRDSTAISYHYDVSNHFYEMVLGPSMTYTCACYPGADSTLEEAQEHKYDLVAKKLGLTPGMRLLDVGCGTGNVALAAAARGAQVTAVDPSAELVARARTRPGADAVTWGVMEGEELPVAPASFDVVALR